MAKHTMNIGSKQAEWVDWALGAMDDFWTHPDEATAREGKLYEEEALPKLDGRSLQIDHCPTEIVMDLIYRIEEQAVDMAEQEGDHSGERAAKTLGKRLRKFLCAETNKEN